MPFNSSQIGDTTKKRVKIPKMAFHSLFVSLSFSPFWTIFRIYIDRLSDSCFRTFNCIIIIYLCTHHLLLMYKYTSFICHRTRCYIIDVNTRHQYIYIYMCNIYRETNYQHMMLLWSYGSWVYRYLCNQYLSPLMLWIRISIRAGCTTLCDKVCQWLATNR